jgi:hypothetical protein
MAYMHESKGAGYCKNCKTFRVPEFRDFVCLK